MPPADESEDWTQMPIDEQIVRCLAESDLVLSPTIIAENIDKSRAEVSRRLSVLCDKGLVERVGRGRYRVTDTGRAWLTGS